MIALRVLALGLYLLLGQRYPPETREVGGGFPEVHRLLNAAQTAAITNTEDLTSLTSQVAQTPHTTTVTKYANEPKYTSEPTEPSKTTTSKEPARHILQSSRTKAVKEPTGQAIPPLEATPIKEPERHAQQFREDKLGKWEAMIKRQEAKFGKSWAAMFGEEPEAIKEPTSQVIPSLEVTVVEERAVPVEHHIEATAIRESARHVEQSSDGHISKEPTSRVIPPIDATVKIETVTHFQKSPGAELREERVNQARQDWIDPHFAYFECCNFVMIRLTSQLLQPPYDVADTVEINTMLKPATQQLAEIARLLLDNWQTLVDRHGYQEVVRLHDGLVEWIEKPLEHGCTTLQNLQATLVSLVDVNNKESRGVRKALLMDTLQKYEEELSDHLANEDLGLRVPAWSRQAPELRSDVCPNQDCFSVKGYPIDLVTADLPHKILRAVRDLQDNLNPGVYQTAKLVALRTWWLLLWWFSLFSMLLSTEFLLSAFLAVLFSILYRLSNGEYGNIELNRMSFVRRRRDNNRQGNNN